MITSNSVQTWALKHLCFLVGTILLGLSIYMVTAPISIEMGQFESYSTNHFDTVIIMSIGVILILVNTLYYRKVKIVSIDKSKLHVKNGINWIEYDWDDLATLSRVRFVSPPLYKLKIKNTSETVFFVTESQQGTYTEINLPFMSFIFDRSQMGKKIKHIKNSKDI